MMHQVKGQRNTSQRRLLLDLLRRSEGHLDADDLYSIAKKLEPRISLSTVYRNLNLFKDLGLVEERHLADEHHHYEVKHQKEHHHVVCLDCGKVVEFEYPSSKQLRKEIGHNTGFEIDGGEICLKGHCEQCRQRRD